MTSKKELLTVFPDTNIFLHYPPIDQIDWLKWCGGKSVKLVLCLKVIDELDGKKDNPNLGERAGKVIKKIKELISQNGGNIKNDVILVMYSKDLNKANISADETIIQQVLDYKSNNQSEDIFIMSEDLGMQVRCGDRVEIIEPDKEQRLVDPSSELHKENLQLKQTIKKIESSIPKLLLSFCNNDENGHVKYELCPPTKKHCKKITKAIDNLCQKYSINGSHSMMSEIHLLRGMFSDDECNRYDEEFKKFITNIESYFNKIHEFKNMLRRIIGLELEISNIGGKPAEDVDLLIHFPNGFKMYTENNFPGIPAKPVPPKKPRTQLELLKERVCWPEHSILSSYRLPNINPAPSFALKKTNSYEFTDYFHRIKHGSSVKLPELYIEFESYESAASFSFDYELRPENLPNKKTGTLNIIIEKK